MTLHQPFSAIHRASCAPVSPKHPLAARWTQCVATGALVRVWHSDAMDMLPGRLVHPVHEAPVPHPRMLRLA